MSVSSEEHQELIATAARLRDRAKAAEARLEQAEAWIKAAMETGDSGLVAALKQAAAERDGLKNWKANATEALDMWSRRAERAEAALMSVLQIASNPAKPRNALDGILSVVRSALAEDYPRPNDRKAT